jgi:carboxylesterase type B
MGESAGGASIMHHLTAWGSRRPSSAGAEASREPLFARAIVQSAAWSITPDVAGTWRQTLAAAARRAGREDKDVTSAAALRTLPASALISANQDVTFGSSPGAFTYGPTLDGGYVPAPPGRLLLDGIGTRGGNSEIAVLVGHNLNESAAYAPPLATAAELAAAVDGVLVGVDAATKAYVLAELYPDVLDGSHGYTTERGRGILLSTEAAFSCNARYLAAAFARGDRARAYRFDVPPGYHADDVPYTFFAGGADDAPTADVAVPAVAVAMQRYLTTFAMTGSPNRGSGGGGLPAWPRYGDDATLLTFGADGVGRARDETANHRCAWWQKAEYLKKT